MGEIKIRGRIRIKIKIEIKIEIKIKAENGIRGAGLRMDRVDSISRTLHRVRQRGGSRGRN